MDLSEFLASDLNALGDYLAATLRLNLFGCDAADQLPVCLITVVEHVHADRLILGLAVFLADDYVLRDVN